jgi:hypothetical protein
MSELKKRGVVVIKCLIYNMKLEFVYFLRHTHEDERLENGEDVKLIGVYSSRVNAEEALLRSKMLKGFSDHQDGFEIDPYRLDQDQWTAGFITEDE